MENGKPAIYHLISPKYNTKAEAVKELNKPEYKGCIVEKRRERIGSIGSKLYSIYWGIFYTFYK